MGQLAMMTQKERAAHAEFLDQSQESCAALTLTFNQPHISMDRIKHDLRSLHAHVDRALLGPRFQKKLGERSQFWAVVEMIKTYPHVHLGWDFKPPQRGYEVLRDLLDMGLWHKFAPRGGHNLQSYSSGWSGGWSNYSTKHIMSSDDVIFSSDFLPTN